MKPSQTHPSDLQYFSRPSSLSRRTVYFYGIVYSHVTVHFDDRPLWTHEYNSDYPIKAFQKLSSRHVILAHVM